jgi:hypothetical protein
MIRSPGYQEIEVQFNGLTGKLAGLHASQPDGRQDSNMSGFQYLYSPFASIIDHIID